MVNNPFGVLPVALGETYSASAAARTSSTWPLTFTFRQARATRPSRPIRNVARSTPMLAHFRAADRALAIEDAVLRGPQLGASFSGRYDARTTDVTVIGTYIPLFPLNNLFGQIPIIGLALGAGPREGLIGVTFKVEGPVSEPHVFINPLSAVAPGIFRKIFDFQ